MPSGTRWYVLRPKGWTRRSTHRASEDTSKGFPEELGSILRDRKQLPRESHRNRAGDGLLDEAHIGGGWGGRADRAHLWPPRGAWPPTQMHRAGIPGRRLGNWGPGGGLARQVWLGTFEGQQDGPALLRGGEVLPRSMSISGGQHGPLQ